MKRFSLLSVICAVLFTVGCSQIDEQIDYAGGLTVTSLDAFIDDDLSRTYAETGADGSMRMLWSANDRIAVTDLATASEFKLKSGADTQHGVFVGSIASVSTNMYAVYPASAANIDGKDVKVTLPSVQVYTPVAEVNVEDRNLMIGSSSDAAAFSFKTIASVARFAVTVPAGETISSIKMRVEDGYLSGTGSVNLQARTLGTLDKREVTLIYAEPAVGSTSDGWALVSPIDFTTTSGKVYYDVTTDKGVYTFCRRPTKAMLAGYIYTFPLDVASFEKVSSESALADGKYYFKSNSSSLTVRLMRATDTTISVAWSSYGFPADYTADAADKHEICLYDENEQLLVAWQPSDDKCITNNALFPYSASNPTCPPRFIFSGLTPNTTYKVQVKNVSKSKTSEMMTFATAPKDCDAVVSTARQAGDVIVFENFGKLVWNGDISTLAAGYVPSDYTKVTNIDDATAWGDYRSSSQTEYKYTKRDREQNLFTTYSKPSLVESFGLSAWAYWRNAADNSTSSTSSTALVRPGYLKLGATKVRAGIVTPKLAALLGKATVRVVFKACAYGTASCDDDCTVGVMAVKGGTVNSTTWRLTGETQVAKKNLTISTELKWNTYTVELNGVTPDSRIVVCGDAASVSSKNNRFLVDDIRVEFVSYEETVATDVPFVEHIASTSHAATIEWSEVEQASRKYVVNLYRDANCSDLIQSYTTLLGNSNYVGAWPARFTFPYLNAGTTYYATVKTLAGVISNPVAVHTLEEGEQRQNDVVYTDFDTVCWGGDYMNMAASVKLNVNSTKTYAPAALSDAISNSNPVAATADGFALTAYSDKVISLFGLTGWESKNAYTSQGYMKLGSASEGGYLTTPSIINLMDATVKFVVNFKACPYVDDKATAQTSFIYVNLLDGETSAEKQTKKVDIGGMRNIPGWSEFEVVFENAKAGDKIQFKSGGEAQSRFCLDDVHISSPSAVSGGVVYGHVYDDMGKPMSGVVVSDGFTAVQTAANGYYQLATNKDCWYIYVSIPADCEVPINEYGQPAFYQKYTSKQSKYDFTLTKLEGGAETKFTLFCLADPQCKDSTQRSRFKNECVPDLKDHAATKGVPCYGVTLGDVTYSEGNRNCVSQMPYLRDHMAVENTGMPIFQTMGNHDYTYFGPNTSISADETSSTYNMKAQRAFEEVFGPIDYSWNRGDAHIVCMRNMQWNATNNAANYSLAFTDDQYNWLKQDLSFVPKDKLIIFCVHIPLTNSTGTNVRNVISLLAQYDEAHIMSGHTHYMRNEPTLSSGVYEHVHAAVCGCWWYSNANGDGVPNGYGVYDIDGKTIKSWYYKGVNTGMDDRNYQMRLYPGDYRCGGTHEYIQLQHGDGVLLANVFNSDPNWTVEVYEDNVYSGKMTRMSNKKDAPNAGTSQSNPTKPSTASTQDWWAIGYHIGVVGRGHVGGTRANYLTNSFHLYKYTLKNKNASIKVVATDRFGVKYTETHVMEDYDYSLMTKR